MIVLLHLQLEFEVVKQLVVAVVHVVELSKSVEPHW